MANSKKMWIPYEQRREQPQDFDVHYRFYSQNEGGRATLPHQGLRCDFAYENELDHVYMIWPEFEDGFGKVIDDPEIEVPREGIARMWIVDPEFREQVHKGRIIIWKAKDELPKPR